MHTIAKTTQQHFCLHHPSLLITSTHPSLSLPHPPACRYSPSDHAITTASTSSATFSCIRFHQPERRQWRQHCLVYITPHAMPAHRAHGSLSSLRRAVPHAPPNYPVRERACNASTQTICLGPSSLGALRKGPSLFCTLSFPSRRCSTQAGPLCAPPSNAPTHRPVCGQPLHPSSAVLPHSASRRSWSYHTC